MVNVSGDKSKSGQTSTQSIFQPQADAITDLISRAQGISQGPAATQSTLLGREGALNQAQQVQPFLGQAQAANQFLLNPQSNPFLGQAAQGAIRPIFQNLTESILPNLRGEATGAGQFGSTRQGIAEGLASRGALQEAGDITSDIFSKGFGQTLQGLVQGLQQAPQTAQLGFLPSDVQRGIGAEQQLDPFNQLAQLQQLIGQPTVLGESAGGSRGGGFGFGIGEK